VAKVHQLDLAREVEFTRISKKLKRDREPMNMVRKLRTLLKTWS
jgi:hypothetical protein